MSRRTRDVIPALLPITAGGVRIDRGRLPARVAAAAAAAATATAAAAAAALARKQSAARGRAVGRVGQIKRLL